ncbi:MAG: phosphodiester glycosidase family protein [Clostridia bacterium]|nr:phosphodiester glycosidase family protein [Clostridia bacterium]
MRLVCLLLALLTALTGSAAAMELTEDTLYDPIPLRGAAPYKPHEKCFLPDQSGYRDESLEITVETFRRHDTAIMAVRVSIQDSSQLRTAMAARPPSRKTVVVSTMAKKNNAVLAINGDYFNYHEKGLVVRGGKLYRNQLNGRRDVLIIDTEGDFTILRRCEKDDFQRYAENTLHAFSFGPGLVINGQIPPDLGGTEVDNAPEKPTQRIAIGQTGYLEYLIIATEGPENKGSTGLTIDQMAELCREMGCINAYNLDGGSSSTIVLHNRKINALSTGKVRPVGDCIYFATLIPDE